MSLQKLGEPITKLEVIDLFERLGVQMNISTALGAWHYATVLARLSNLHSRNLERKFDDAKQHIKTTELLSMLRTWSMRHQINDLKLQGKIKSSDSKTAEVSDKGEEK